MEFYRRSYGSAPLTWACELWRSWICVITMAGRCASYNGLSGIENCFWCIGGWREIEEAIRKSPDSTLIIPYDTHEGVFDLKVFRGAVVGLYLMYEKLC